MTIGAINSVGSASSTSIASGVSSTKLSEDTKKKLKELGLDPSQYSSEAEAKAAIAAKEHQKTEGAKKAGGGDFKRIEEEAQSLAAEMGISAGSNDKISDIMDKISNKISELESGAGSDKTKLAQVNDFSNKYTTISNELAQLQAAKNMTGATALGNYNKASLGL